MVYLDIKIYEHNITLEIFKNKEYIEKINRSCNNSKQDNDDAYKTATSVITESLQLIEDEEFTIYVNHIYYFALTNKQKEVWMKGLKGSFSDAADVLFDSFAKTAIYFTNKEYKNRISFVFDKVTTGYIISGKNNREIFENGYKIDGSLLSLSTLGSVIFRFVKDSGNKKIIQEMLKIFYTNDIDEAVAQVYKGDDSGINGLAELSKKNFIKFLSENLQNKEKEDLTNLIKSEVDRFVDIFYQRYSGLLNKKYNMDIVIVGRVFTNMKRIHKYFKEKINEKFPESDIYFEELKQAVTFALPLMIDELKW